MISKENKESPVIRLLRTNSHHPDFQKLIVLLDAGLTGQYENHATDYAPHNLVGYIETVVIAYSGDKAVGCGCFKKFNDTHVEIKRMFVDPEYRGRGIASAILHELETWARALGHLSAVLETGNKQVEAISLYIKAGYKRIDNYGPYAGLEESLCFGKEI